MNQLCTTQNIAFNNSNTMVDRWAKALMMKMLSRIKAGKITLTDDGVCHTFGNDPSLSAHIHVLNPEFYRKVALGGSIGAGESYMDNDWTVDSLTTLVRILVRNAELMDRMESGMARMMFPLRVIRHKLNRNSKNGAKKNILSHYDLGTEMYKSFLDPTMMYSSALYTEQHSTLEAASLHKLDTICRKLNLKPSDRVVEIGAGWGGFAIYAAQNYGCHVTTTTISSAQYMEARERIAQAGLESNITLLQKDYRDLTGQYDKLVSIEMIEAVGHEYHDDFFKTCQRLLKSDGQMLIQAITIADQKYAQYARSVDFLQEYIFPGGCVPSVQRMVSVLAKHTDMVVRGLEDFGQSYAQTLKDWRHRFNRALPSLRERGYDGLFTRLWNYYLSYCEGGFRERAISVVHLVATRPGYLADRRHP